MDSSQLTNVLINAQNPDPNLRRIAEKWIQDAQNQNLGLFLHLLCMELANNEKPTQTRRLAGLLIKNTLTSKDDVVRAEKIKKWSEIDPNIRSQIKANTLSTLGAPDKDARHTAALVLAAIAHVELPLNLWPELIQTLLGNMQQQNENLKQSTLEALGYVCEEIDPDILATQSNEILTAVCKGIKDPQPQVKLAGLHALYNALDFVRSNFEKQNERDYIMAVILESATFQDVDIRVASFECLASVAGQYYDKLAPYMQKIFNLSLQAIQNEPDQVAQQAVEIWSTICEEEMDIAEELEEVSLFP